MSLSASVVLASSSSPGLSLNSGRDDEVDLLAAVLRHGLATPIDRESAVDLIDRFGGLAELASADDAALRREGLPDAQIAMLGRVRALALAMARAQVCRRPVLSSWTALTAYLRMALAHLPREELRLLVVDRLFDRAELRSGDRRPQVVRLHRLAGDGR